MVLDLREMLAGVCDVVPFSFLLEPPGGMAEQEHGRLRGVRFSAPIRVEGQVTDTAGYIRWEARIEAAYVAACARCLEPVEGRFALEIARTLATEAEIAEMEPDVADDFLPIVDGRLDADEFVSDIVYMEFPSKVLCREDCRGLCPRCGKNLNDGPCGCAPETDPRLAALSSILEELKEKEEKQNHP